MDRQQVMVDSQRMHGLTAQVRGRRAGPVRSITASSRPATRNTLCTRSPKRAATKAGAARVGSDRARRTLAASRRVWASCGSDRRSDDALVRVQLAGQQGHFQVDQLAFRGGHQGPGRGGVGLAQHFRHGGVADDDGHPQPAGRGHEAVVPRRLDDHHPCSPSAAAPRTTRKPTLPRPQTMTWPPSGMRRISRAPPSRARSRKLVTMAVNAASRAAPVMRRTLTKIFCQPIVSSCSCMSAPVAITLMVRYRASGQRTCRRPGSTPGC